MNEQGRLTLKPSDLKTASQVEEEQSRANPEVRRELERTALANDVAIRVITYRVEHGLSQTQLARKLGMHQPAIARLESGDHEPSLSTLGRLAKGLGIEFRISISSVGKIELLPDQSPPSEGTSSGRIDTINLDPQLVRVLLEGLPVQRGEEAPVRGSLGPLPPADVGAPQPMRGVFVSYPHGPEDEEHYHSLKAALSEATPIVLVWDPAADEGEEREPHHSLADALRDTGHPLLVLSKLWVGEEQNARSGSTAEEDPYAQEPAQAKGRA